MYIEIYEYTFFLKKKKSYVDMIYLEEFLV